MMTEYERALLALVASDEAVIILTAENRAPLRNAIPALGKHFVDVGIAEQTMIGMAAGLALRGRRPIVHALSAFLTMRAFEFIRTDVGIPGLPVIMVGFIPGVLSEANGPTHQAIEDIALMRLIPGVNVFCPSDISELSECLPEIVRSQRPWYIRYASSARIPGTGFPMSSVMAGQVIALDGEDVCIVTYGPLLQGAMEAATLLAGEGISAAVVHAPILRSSDPAAFTSLYRRFPLIVTLEDHFRNGALSSMLMENLAALAPRLAAEGRRLPMIVPMTLGDRWFRPGLLKDVLDLEGFSPAKVAGFILNVYTREIGHYA